MSENHQTFIDHYLDHTRFYESPTSFWYWSAVTIIGAALRDRCWRRFGDQKLYPNVYTLIIADSAVHRKGHPIALAERLLNAIRPTKIISGRASIQGILDELGRSETDKETGKMLQGGGAIFCAPELSAGVVNDPEAIKILTDIYDFRQEYTSRLRGSGIFRIKNICFSMLAASNEELLRDLYDSRALYGGLLGRTFLVKSSEFRPANSLFNIRDTQGSFDQLTKKLNSMIQLAGEFEFTDAAQQCYEDWYAPFRESYKTRTDKSGVAGRIHTSVIKLAMILCVNSNGGQELIVNECHIQEAIDRCLGLMPNYQSFVMSAGKATESQCAGSLIEDIWLSKTNSISKKEFIARHFHEYDHEIIDKTIAKLDAAGCLQTTYVSNETYYDLTAKCVQIFNLGEKK